MRVQPPVSDAVRRCAAAQKTCADVGGVGEANSPAAFVCPAGTRPKLDYNEFTGYHLYNDGFSQSPGCMGERCSGLSVSACAELCPSDCADQGSVGCTEADCCAPIPQAFCGDKHGYFRYHSEEPDAMHDPNMAGMLLMY